MGFVSDTLIWKDEKGFVLAQGESLEHEKAYLFQLRSDVKWHNGQRFTADDVVPHFVTFVWLLGFAS